MGMLINRWQQVMALVAMQEGKLGSPPTAKGRISHRDGQRPSFHSVAGLIPTPTFNQLALAAGAVAQPSPRSGSKRASSRTPLSNV